MKIKRWTGYKVDKLIKIRWYNLKKDGGKEIKMCILAKPINHNFIVDKNKADQFLKSHKSNMEKILAKAEKFEKNLKK